MVVMAFCRSCISCAYGLFDGPGVVDEAGVLRGCDGGSADTSKVEEILLDAGSCPSLTTLRFGAAVPKGSSPKSSKIAALVGPYWKAGRV